MKYFIGLILLISSLYTFYKLYPPLGGTSNPNQWLSSKNFYKSIFHNQITTSMHLKPADMASLVVEQLRGGTMRQPIRPIQPISFENKEFLDSKSPQMVWLGHSSVLMRLNELTVLTDPILSKRSSPFPFIGPKRTISELPLTVEDLPPIDAVFISHDHYDHLDYATIKELRNKTTMFFVPLGIGAHLRKWGIQSVQITELDWWESVNFKNLTLSCTPSRHFSGRTLNDRFKTLWCSWVIESKDIKIFFSGDTGYGPHFKQVGDKFGPFDITLMECGQYDRRWADIHMTPEQTVSAHEDLHGKRLFPIHWGAFSLALHPWDESVKRAQSAATHRNVILVSAKIGEIMSMNAGQSRVWWDK